MPTRSPKREAPYAARAASGVLFAAYASSSPWHVACIAERMAIPFDQTRARDPRALSILAKTIYKELRANGYEERDILMLASELLGAVTSEVKASRSSKGD